MEMYQVVSLLVAGGAFVGVIVLGVVTSLKWWGKRAYRKLFPSELLYTVLYAVPIWLIYSAYSNLHLSLSATMAGLSLFFVAALVWSYWRPTQPAPILLHLGCLNSELAQAVGIFVVFTAAGSIGLAISDKDDLVVTILVAVVYFVVGGIYLYQMSRKQATITKVGLDTGQRLIKWEQIESYEWIRRGGKMDTLLLRLKRRIPLMKTTAIRLPAKQYEAANSLLSEYTSKSL